MIYSIDLYKYPHINEFEIEDILNYQSEKMIGYNLKTTFSIFDKMLITPHNKIKDIRKVDKLNYTWTGKHQKTIIYDIPYTPTDNTIIFDKDDFKCYNEPDRSVNFMSISMITLSPDAQKYFIWHKDNFIDKINHYIKEICNLVENNNSGINFKLYGTLGSNDFTLILLSDDYANIVYTVEALKYYKLKYEDIEKYYSVIVDIYTIINWSNKDNNLISNNRPIDIFLSERINFDITDNFVPKKVILGEYDIHLNENLDPSKYLLGGKYDFFDINQFNKNYFQINTQISYEVDNLSQYIPNKNNKLNIGSQYIYKNKIKDELGELEDIFKLLLENEILDINGSKNIDSNQIIQTLENLYHDFLSNYISMFSGQWKDDIYHVFFSTIKKLISLCQNKENIFTEHEIIEFITLYIDCIRQYLLHIAQSNQPFFQIPNTHLRYTGLYNKVLLSYYGVIKKYIELSYSMPRYSAKEIIRKTEIIPYITFNLQQLINSVIVSNKYNSEKDVLIINFSLPYSAFTNVKKYSILLAHEIYHYISPQCRYTRNQLTGYITVSEFIKYEISKYIYYKLQYNKKTILNSDKSANIDEIKCIQKNIISTLSPIILNFVLDKYFSIVGDFESETTFDEYIANILSSITKQDGHDIGKISVTIKYIIKDILSFTLNNGDILNYLIVAILNDFQKANYHSIVKEDIDRILRELLSGINWDIYTETNIDSLYITNKSDEILNGYLFDDIYTAINCILFAMKEVSADLFMIRIFNLNFIQYYTLYKDIIEKQKFKLEKITLSEKIRLGIIIDYYINYYDIDYNFEENLQINNDLLSKMTENKKENLLLEDVDIDIISNCYLKFNLICKEYRNIIYDYVYNNDIYEINDDKFNKTYLEMKKDFNIIIDNIDKIYDELDIDNSITFMEKMLQQKDFKSLCDNKEKYTKINTYQSFYTNYKREYIDNISIPIVEEIHEFIYKVKSPDQLVHYTNFIHYKIFKDRKLNLLYRGHNKRSYKLLPLLYRADDRINSLTYKTRPRYILEDSLERYKNRILGSRELLSCNYTDIDYTILMQHYDMPTNLLDWTDSIFTAIYFALEKDIHAILNDEKISNEENAVVILLDPNRLNESRNKMIEWYYKGRGINDNQIKEHMMINDYYMPYASIHNNPKHFYSFFVDLSSNQYLRKPYNYDISNPIVFPIAFDMPLSNDRIKMQSGTFVAFCLDVDGDIIESNKEEYFDYSKLSLESMQYSYYLKCRENGIEYKPFYVKIEIEKDSRKDIAQWIINSGIDGSKIYPELTRIAEVVNRDIKRHYSNKLK